jgi:hypothetical protein
MCHGKAQNVPQDGTKRLLNLCATGRHKKTFKTYVPREGTKCAVAQHKKTFKTYVPREGTKCAVARHKKTFRTYVPREGTKCAVCATGRHKMCHSTAQKDLND